MARPESTRGSPYEEPSPTAGSVPEMLEDYRRRRETLETQARELEQLQQDMLKAAERESGAIVSSTRARIASILVEARRDLAQLAVRVEAITGPEDQRPIAPLVHRDPIGPAARAPMADPNAVREALRRARREIGRLLKETKPEIESPFPPLERPSTPIRSAAAPIKPAAAPIKPAAAESPTTESDDEAYRALQESIRRIPIERAHEIPTPPPPRPVFGAPERVERPPFRSDFEFDLNALNLNTLRQSRQVRVLAFVLAALAIVAAIWWMQRSSAPVTGGAATPRSGSVPPPTSSPAPTERTAAPANPTGVVLPERSNSLKRPLTKDEPAPPPSSAARAPAPAQTAPAPASPPPRASPERTGSPPADSSSVSAELMTTAQRWLDAYSRRDTAGMQAVAVRNMKISDQRPAPERLPPTAEAVRRTLENVSFQFVGETAIMTARLTEQGNVGGQSPHFVSWISLMWIRESEHWQLMDVQILSDSQLRQRPGR